jgi:hypothetical protein
VNVTRHISSLFWGGNKGVWTQSLGRCSTTWATFALIIFQVGSPSFALDQPQTLNCLLCSWDQRCIPLYSGYLLKWSVTNFLWGCSSTLILLISAYLCWDYRLEPPNLVRTYTFLSFITENFYYHVRVIQGHTL